MIKNYLKENISSCSYDFRLGAVFRPIKGKLVDIESDSLPELKELKLPYILKPGEFVIGQTIEEFDMPLDVMSFYAVKSAAFRVGLNVICGANDPGYVGKATMGIHNVSENPIRLFSGMKLLRTIFTTLEGDAIPVQTRYMGGKVI